MSLFRVDVNSNCGGGPAKFAVFRIKHEIETHLRKYSEFWRCRRVGGGGGGGSGEIGL